MCDYEKRGNMNKTISGGEKRGMRLDKLIASEGISRQEAKKLIAGGRVTVDGKTIKDPGFSVTEENEISVGGEAIAHKKHIHLMIHKPAGVLTATEDARGQKTVADFLPYAFLKRKIGPVGRLDKDVTGLVLMTTDGQLAHRLISPKWEITKRYRARVEGRLDETCIEAFKNGIAFKDFTSMPAGLEILSAEDHESVCLVYVKEGKFHQVKRMLQAVGHPVIHLHRERIASIELDKALEEGQYRELTDEEIGQLYALTEMNEHG